MNKEWPFVRLDEVCAINPESRGESWPHKIIRYIDISSVGTGVMMAAPALLAKRDAPSRAQRLVRPGDTILSTVRPNRRSFLFIPNPPAETVVSTGFAVLRATPRIDPRFLYYTISDQSFADFIESHAEGSAYPAVSPAAIGSAPIPLPPLPIQKRIAHILGTLDDKIELNRRMNETLEAMARAIFKSWFIDFDPVHAKAAGRDTGLPRHIADLFSDSFADSALGPIPRGWKSGSLGDVAESPRRGVKPSDLPPATPYIGLEHMPRRSIALDAWDRAEDVASGKSRFEQGEILFGKLRPYFHKVGIAPVDGVCSTDIVVVTPKAAHWHGYVISLVSSEAFVSYTDSRSAGTKMPRTNWKDMGRYPLALPPGPLPNAFQYHVAALHKRIGVNVRQNRRLADLRNALLPKLLSGEFAIPKAEKAISEAT